jgi:hypothetical protein
MRVVAGNKCYYALGHIQRRGYVAYSLIVGLYKAVIRLIVTYGDERGS